MHCVFCASAEMLDVQWSHGAGKQDSQRRGTASKFPACWNTLLGCLCCCVSQTWQTFAIALGVLACGLLWALQCLHLLACQSECKSWQTSSFEAYAQLSLLSPAVKTALRRPEPALCP